MTINAIRLPGLRKRTAPNVEVGRLMALSLTVTENINPLNTASMEIPADDTQVEVGDFVELFDSVGSLGVYRVSGMSFKYKRRRIQSLTLEHAISTLTGGYVYKELTYQDNEQNAYEIIQELIDKQPEKFWQVDTSKTAEITYLQSKTDGMHFSDCDLLDALLDFQAFLPDETILTYDFSVFPWKVMTLRNPTAVDSEIRLSRNATEATIAYDYTNLVTRIYGSTGSSQENAFTLADASKNTGKKLYVDADTVSKYGIITTVYTVGDAETANELYDKCVKHLEKKKNPGVTITITGTDLTRISGESLDHFRPGYVCRLCIPEDDLTLQYKVLKVDHSDLCKKAADVTVTMGTDERRTASKKRETRTGGGGGGGGGSGGPGGNTREYEDITRVFGSNHFFTPGVDPYYYYNLTIGTEFEYIASLYMIVRTTGGSQMTITINNGGGFNVPNGNVNIMGYMSRDDSGKIERGVAQHFTFHGAFGEQVFFQIFIKGKKLKSS